MSGALDIGTLTGTIQLEDGFSSVLSTIEANFTASSKKLEKIGSDFSKAGKTLSLAITAPLVLASGAALTFSGEFEATMTRLVSLAGVSGDELAKVKEHILDLAPAVGVGPQALADAMTVVSSTVSDTSVAMSILDIAAKGSAAGMGDTKDVAKALTAVINSYGAANITAAEAGDILTQTVKDGGAEAKELAPTLANVVPMAAQLGISFKEVGANIATFTKLGVPAAEAVTSLSSVMTALLKTSKQGTEALASVGLTYAGLRAEIQQKGLAAAMLDLTQRFGDNKEALTDVFGRIEALRNVMGTAGQQAETYSEVLGNITNSVGTLDGAFEAMKGKQIQTWNELKAQVDVIAIKLGDTLAPAFAKVLEAARPLLDVIANAIKWFSELPAPVQTTVIAIAAAAAAIGPLLFAIGQMASGIAALSPLIAPLGVAIGLLSGPVGLVAIAITGVTAAIIAFKSSVNNLESVNKAGQPLKDLKDGTGHAILTIDEFNKKLSSTPPLAKGASLTLAGFAKATDDAAAGSSHLALASEESLKKLADWKAKAAEAASSMDTLSGAQIEAIKWYLEQKTSASDVAVILDIYKQQVDQVIDAEKRRISAMKESVEYQKKVKKAQEDAFADIGQATLRNLREQNDADQRREDMALDSHQKQLVEIDRWVAAEKAKLETRSANYAQAAQAIEDAGEAERLNLERLRQIADQQDSWKFVGPELPADVATKLAKSFTAQFGDIVTHDIPAILMKAFEGGGGVMGAVKSLAADIGGRIFKSDTVQGWTAGLTSKLTNFLHVGKGLFGDALSSIMSGGVSTAIQVGMQYLVKGLEKLRSIGGPSKQEKEGRSVVDDFEKGFASTTDMINRVGDAYRANGRTAEEAQAALQRMWAAEKLGAEATRAALAEINEQLKRQKEITDSISSQGFKSQDQITHEADIANEAYKTMLAAVGQYTEAQISSAYRHYQELLAQLEGAAGDAARAWLEANKASDDAAKSGSSAMQKLIDERDKLAQSVANEAPEEVMGVIEAQTRGQMEALQKQMDAQQEAIAKQAEDTAAAASDAAAAEAERQKQLLLDQAAAIAEGIERALNGINPNVITLHARWDLPPMPLETGLARPADSTSYFAGGSGPLDFMPRGSDTIPAMLTPGERVLSVSENRAFEAGISTAQRSNTSEGKSPSVTIDNIVVHMLVDDRMDQRALAKNFIAMLRSDSDAHDAITGIAKKAVSR